MTQAAPSLDYTVPERQSPVAMARTTWRLTLRPALAPGDAGLESEWLADGPGYLAVYRNNDGVSVGHVQLKRLRDCAVGRAAELTYAIAPAFHGRGYATEAVAAALRLAYEDAGLDYVVACVEPENVAAVRVVEKNGLVAVASRRVLTRIIHRGADIGLADVA